MSTAKLLASPLWFPFWLAWNILAGIGKAVWFVFTLSIKVAFVGFAIFGLIVWLWW